MKWLTLKSMVLIVATALFPAKEVNGQAWDYPVPTSQYFNWHKSSGTERTFYYDQVHLGEDSNLAEETPIRAIGAGEIAIYKKDGGYPYGFGELYAVIKHDLGREYEFVNGYGQVVNTRYIRSVYGHIRKSQEREGQELTWKIGDQIQPGQVIGYINDDAHNGDSTEHLHTGVILDWAPVDSYGYDYQHNKGHRFAAASEVIATLNTGLYTDGWQSGTSDDFLTAYHRNGGHSELGSPWDNSYVDGPYVHCWPDDCSHHDTLDVQDFLTEDDEWSMLVRNEHKDEVYLVKGCVLHKWFFGWGYSDYGPPTEDTQCVGNRCFKYNLNHLK